jgi:hypothetical protein
MCFLFRFTHTRWTPQRILHNQIICVASREVLLSFVKKDVNLTPYSGGIQLPASLFRRAQGSDNVSLSKQSGASSARSSLDSF